jgi:alkylation response protein AidB-like acyl-CoA dehydrogenase
MSEVFFDDCEVSEDDLLGRPGAGMAIFNSSMEWERSCILASAVGTMQRQLEGCVAYARERKQFGQPIGKFQAVSHRIVDMKVRLESARLLLYRLGWLRTQGKPSPMEAAMVKLYLSECFVQNSLDALQVHGGYGYVTEYDLEREVRDAIGSRIYSGTSEIQRNIVAGYLGL